MCFKKLKLSPLKYNIQKGLSEINSTLYYEQVFVFDEGKYLRHQFLMIFSKKKVT